MNFSDDGRTNCTSRKKINTKPTNRLKQCQRFVSVDRVPIHLTRTLLLDSTGELPSPGPWLDLLLDIPAYAPEPDPW